jgi:hypothetical protein
MQEPADNRVARLAEVLMQTKQAHGRFEVEELGGQADEDWPGWYAQYLRDNRLLEPILGPDLPDSLTSGLKQALTQADSRYAAGARDEPWTDYYARYLIALTQPL